MDQSIYCNCCSKGIKSYKQSYYTICHVCHKPLCMIPCNICKRESFQTSKRWKICRKCKKTNNYIGCKWNIKCRVCKVLLNPLHKFERIKQVHSGYCEETIKVIFVMRDYCHFFISKDILIDDIKKYVLTKLLRLIYLNEISLEITNKI